MKYNNYLGVLLSYKPSYRQKRRTLKKLRKAIYFNGGIHDTVVKKINYNFELGDVILNNGKGQYKLVYPITLGLTNYNRDVTIYLNKKVVEKVDTYNDFKILINNTADKIKNLLEDTFYKIATNYNGKLSNILEFNYPKSFIDFLDQYKLYNVYIDINEKDYDNIYINSIKLCTKNPNFNDVGNDMTIEITNNCSYIDFDFFNHYIREYIKFLNKDKTRDEKIYIAELLCQTIPGREYGFRNISVYNDDDFEDVKYYRQYRIKLKDIEEKHIRNLNLGFNKENVLVKLSHITEKSVWFKPIEFLDYIINKKNQVKFKMNLFNRS